MTKDWGLQGCFQIFAESGNPREGDEGGGSVQRRGRWEWGTGGDDKDKTGVPLSALETETHKRSSCVKPDLVQLNRLCLLVPAFR